MATKTTKKMDKKILFKTDNIPDSDRSYFYSECFEFNNKIFRYVVDFHNGVTSSNQYVEIMTNDGSWSKVAGALSVGAYFGNPYISHKAVKEKAKEQYIAAFDKFISAVYGR